MPAYNVTMKDFAVKATVISFIKLFTVVINSVRLKITWVSSGPNVRKLFTSVIYEFSQ